MRTIYQFTAISLLSLFIISCSTSYTPYAYDDLYYSPNNDPIKQVQKNPREDFNKTNNIQYQNNNENRYVNDEKPADYPQSVYRNRYTEAEANENAQPQSFENTGNTNNYSEDEEYYDEEYATTLQRMGSPVRSFNTYDPYQRDRILYTYDPFFVQPTVYGSYRFWDPFVPTTGLSVGWNSYSGWNVGVGVGYGYGYGGFGCAPLNPYYGYYDPFFPRYNAYWGVQNFWGYNNFFNPYNSFRGYDYAVGYHNGYNNGYYNGNYGGRSSDGVNRVNGRRQISAPRGSSGSGTPATTGTTRPTRRPTNTAAGREKANTTVVSPKTNTTPSRRPSSPTLTQPETPNKPTPSRYQTPRTPATYSRPSQESRPVRTTPSRQPTVRPSTPQQQQSRPNYSSPRQNNSYNTPSTTPQPRQQQSRPQQVRPQSESRPSYNNTRSRPSYNNNSNSRPSYSAPRSTPSRSSGGSSGGTRRPSRR